MEAEDATPEVVDGGGGFHTDIVGLGNDIGMIGVGDGVQWYDQSRRWWLDVPASLVEYCTLM